MSGLSSDAQPSDTSGWRVIVLGGVTMAADGLDVQLLGVALPALAEAWGLSRGAFVWIAALSVVATSLGGLLGGWIGDRIGRRPAIIGSVIAFGALTAATALADGLLVLGVLRTVTALALGAVLPNVAALCAEAVSIARRSTAMTLAIVCVPAGAALAGWLGQLILPTHGWPMLFVAGGIAPLVLAGVLALLLPESRSFSSPERDRLPSLRPLIEPALRRNTAGVALGFVGAMTSAYLVYNWLPAIFVANSGTLAAASRSIALFNAGGVAGALVALLLVARVGVRQALLFEFGLAALLASLLATTSPRSAAWLLNAGTAALGAAVTATLVALYLLGAEVFATHLRATGIGATSAAGRAGAVASSFVGARLAEDSHGWAAFFASTAVLAMISLIGVTLVRAPLREAPAGPE